MIYNNNGSFIRNAVITTGFIVVTVSIFSMVWLRSSIKTLEYRLGIFQQKQIELMKERRNLLVKKDNLLSISNIDHIAIKKMGFDFPDRTKVIYIKDKGVARVEFIQ
ncbi:MAG: cell division protein FtsL [Candidatus Magnetoovum sp. WYHC-5]|nr:cell division protein FtsL [Candidatus Magnetoovum sp. WYHC-5]